MNYLRLTMGMLVGKVGEDSFPKGFEFVYVSILSK